MLLTISTTHRPATDLGYLLHKNPQRLHEWLSSPIVYSRDPGAVQAIKGIAIPAADRDVFRYHYDRLCRSAWNQMQTPRGATIKRYCYALRPALMLSWLKFRADLPPMDVHHLCAGLAIAGDILHDMAELIRAKASGGEKDHAANVHALDAMIAVQLAVVAPRPEKMDIAASSLRRTADALFRQMIDG
jgi:hypothetical protein